MKKRRELSSTKHRKSSNQDSNFPPNVPLRDPAEPTKNLRRAMFDPEWFAETLRGRLWALWYAALRAPAESILEGASPAISPQLWRKARLELLKTAIHACNLLSHFDEEDFKDIAPSEQGWPIVLGAATEHARDWEKAKAKIKRLQSGTKHFSRLLRESVGEFGEFVDFWIWRAMPEIWTSGATSKDLKQLPKLVLQKLSKYYGPDWQDHPQISAPFAKYDNQWNDRSRYGKRDFVRDKFEAAERTMRKRLARIA